MPEERARVLTPARRVRTFKEVVLGLKTRDAVENARIYLQRERALKGQPCPLGTDHLAMVRLVARGEMAQALALVLKTNPLPEVTGRLCAEVFEETLCQNSRGERVSLRAIERFLAEHYKSNVGEGLRALPSAAASRRRIAVIGSGPAGLCAAFELAVRGYQPQVFDAAPYPGGTLAYGHALFELPRSALERILHRVQSAGVTLVTDFLFGRKAAPADLLEEGFSAVLLATGVGVVAPLAIPQEDAGGIMTADDLLKAVNFRGEDPRAWLGRRVIVVGDTGPAFTCARIARRTGADATVVVPGPETYIKADEMFMRHALEEGVKIKAFTKPVKVLTGGNGCVTGLGCRYLDYRMDTAGRMVLVEDETAGFELEADTVINATDWEANTLFLRDIRGLEFNEDGTVCTKPEFAETSLANVFAAGGVVEPEMSLTDAMLSGLRAAQEIDEKIKP
jgi:glutamate synthase (NADPH/NADH) small chain